MPGVKKPQLVLDQKRKSDGLVNRNLPTITALRVLKAADYQDESRWRSIPDQTNVRAWQHPKLLENMQNSYKCPALALRSE